MKIKQKFYHFTKWEDFNNGMYDGACDRYEEKVALSMELLSDQDEFYSIAKEMVSKWTFSAEQSLTDNLINKKAWIGQASCCFNHHAPDYATKAAWWQLSEQTREEANNTAKKVIQEWRAKEIMKGSLWGKED